MDEDFLTMMFLACVETWEIRYRVMISWRILASFLEDFLEEDYIFLHGEIFEFLSFFFLP
jgi:hypothetical protein